METVKTSWHITEPLYKLRSLCSSNGLTVPYSIREFLNNGLLQFSGSLSSGDVDCNWYMLLRRYGYWSVKGVFHDGGVLGGDFFTLLFGLGGAVSVQLDGSILDIPDSRHLGLKKYGISTWIYENWETIGAGPAVQLWVKPSASELISPFQILDILDQQMPSDPNPPEGGEGWSEGDETGGGPSEPHPPPPETGGGGGGSGGGE